MNKIAIIAKLNDIVYPLSSRVHSENAGNPGEEIFRFDAVEKDAMSTLDIQLSQIGNVLYVYCFTYFVM